MGGIKEEKMRGGSAGIPASLYHIGFRACWQAGVTDKIF